MEVDLKRFLGFHIDLLLKYLLPDSKWVLVLTALLLGGIGLQLIGPLAIRYFIDAALEGGELRGLYVAAVVFMSVGLGGQVLGVVNTYVGRDVAWRATNRMRSELLLHVLKLEMAFHTEHPPGELVERIDGDAETLANFFSRFAIRLLGGALLAVGVLLEALRSAVLVPDIEALDDGLDTLVGPRPPRGCSCAGRTCSYSTTSPAPWTWRPNGRCGSAYSRFKT